MELRRLRRRQAGRCSVGNAPARSLAAKRGKGGGGRVVKVARAWVAMMRMGGSHKSQLVTLLRPPSPPPFHLRLRQRG